MRSQESGKKSGDVEDVFNKKYSNIGPRIEKSKTTMENCYDIVLEKEDYTLGKVLEF